MPEGSAANSKAGGGGASGHEQTGSTFLSFFHESRVRPWRPFYLDLFGLMSLLDSIEKQAAHADPSRGPQSVPFAFGESEKPKHGHHRHSAEEVEVPKQQQPPPATADITAASSFAALRDLGAKVRIGLDLWLDDPNEQLTAEAAWRRGAATAAGQDMQLPVDQLAEWLADVETRNASWARQASFIAAATGERRAPRNRAKANLRFVVQKVKVSLPVVSGGTMLAGVSNDPAVVSEEDAASTGSPLSASRKGAAPADVGVTSGPFGTPVGPSAPGVSIPSGASMLVTCKLVLRAGASREGLSVHRVDEPNFARANSVVVSHLSTPRTRDDDVGNSLRSQEERAAVAMRMEDGTPVHHPPGLRRNTAAVAPAESPPLERESSFAIAFAPAMKPVDEVAAPSTLVASRMGNLGEWAVHVNSIYGVTEDVANGIRAHLQNRKQRAAVAEAFGVGTLLDRLADMQTIYDIVSLALTLEVRRVAAFSEPQAANVGSSVVACVDSAKRVSRQTDHARARIARSCVDTFTAIESLIQFRELNRVALFTVLDRLEGVLGHDVRAAANKQLQRLSFVAKNSVGKSGLTELRTHLVRSYGTAYCAPGADAKQALISRQQSMAGADGSHNSRRNALLAGGPLVALLGGLILATLMSIAVDYFSVLMDSPHLGDTSNAVYHFTVTYGILAVNLMFACSVIVWERAEVNFVFLLNLHGPNHFTGLELLRNAFAYFAAWFVCLFAYVRTLVTRHMVASSGVGEDPWYATSFAYGTWGALFLIWAWLQVSHPATRRRWMLPTLRRVLVTPYYPVAFSDFVLTLCMLAFTRVLTLIQVWWCFVEIDSAENSCDKASAMRIYALAQLPHLFRLLQNVRKYLAPLPHQRTLFPSMVNAIKYALSLVIGYVAFGEALANYHDAERAADDHYDVPFRATLYVLMITDVVFRLFWDWYVDAGLAPASTLAEMHSKRQERMAALFGPDDVAEASAGDTGSGCDTDDSDGGGGGGATPMHDNDDRVPFGQDGQSHHHRHHGHHEPKPPGSPTRDMSQVWYLLPKWPLRPILLPPTLLILTLIGNFLIRWMPLLRLALREELGKLSPSAAAWMTVLWITLDVVRRFCTMTVRVEHEQVRNVEFFKATQSAPPPTSVSSATDPSSGRFGTGLLTTTVWDDVGSEMASLMQKPDERHMTLRSGSQVDRFFALLPEAEKSQIVRDCIAYVPTRRRFAGRQGEGKSRWFAARPVDVKLAVLLARIGDRTVEEYATKCVHPDAPVGSPTG